MTFVAHCSLFFGISLCSCCTYVYITHFEIGFVLQKNSLICRGVSTSVEGRVIENAKIKVESAKLRNPDLVGMGVLVVASFSISRILYLLDVYYTRWEFGCQVKSLATKARREPQISQINADLGGGRKRISELK